MADFPGVFVPVTPSIDYVGHYEYLFVAQLVATFSEFGLGGGTRVFGFST